MNDMSFNDRELHAQDAINEFVQHSCAFIIPGVNQQRAYEVGSGVIIRTRENHFVILTAQHVAKDARREQHRLGYFNCSNPLSNFVSGIWLCPNDIDVALLIVNDDLTSPLDKLALIPESVPTSELAIQGQDSLVLNGYPYDISSESRERSEHRFKVMSYWCKLSDKNIDKKGRYRVDWKDAQAWRSKGDFDLPKPIGISGGPLWRFRKPPLNSIWSPIKIGRIVGIQSAWEKETLFIEPVHKWGAWFHECIQKTDEASD
jgi:hypothetical protein